MPTTISRECEHCGSAFEALLKYVKRGGARFCSRPCRQLSQRKRKTKTCTRCESVFVVVPSQDAQEFCTKSCAGKSRTGWTHTEATKAKIAAAAPSGFADPNYVLEDKVCVICHTEYTPTSGAQKYCSPDCGVDMVCEGCDKPFVGRVGRRYCSQSCAGKAVGGTCPPGISYAQGGWYDSPIAGRGYLDSSWEREIAIQLDALGKPWKLVNRGQDGHRFPYDQGKRRYYPDFYIPHLDLYLDPKGYISDASKLKIASVRAENDINLLVIDGSMYREFVRGHRFEVLLDGWSSVPQVV